MVISVHEEHDSDEIIRNTKKIQVKYPFLLLIIAHYVYVVAYGSINI